MYTKAHRAITPEMIEGMKADRVAGMMAKDIAEKYNVCVQTVTRYTRDLLAELPERRYNNGKTTGTAKLRPGWADEWNAVTAQLLRRGK